MPSLSRFYGIVIKMYFRKCEHNPPHVHAVYGDDAAAFDIKTGEIMDGWLPPRAEAMVSEWITAHREELVQIWESQEFRSIEPLD
jgi:hypothetical protein